MYKLIKYFAVALAAILIVNIFSFIIYLFASVGNIFYEDEKGEFRQNIILGEISILEIDINASNISIKKSDSFKVETNNKNIKVEEIDNKLIIKENKKNWFKAKKYFLDIYLPNTIFEDVTIKNKAGKLQVEELISKEINLDLGAGKVDISYLKVEEIAKIKGGAGEINISSGMINNLDLEIGVGKLTLNSNLIGNNKIEAGIGEFNLKLYGTILDYEITPSKGLGTFKIQNEEIENNKVYGNGTNKIEINGGIGSIDINFYENNL